MKNLFFCLATVFLFGCSQEASISGTYSYRNEGDVSDIKITQISKNEIEFSIVAANPQGNSGEISGKAIKSGELYKFVSKDFDCDLELQFKGANLSLKQNGGCGFGMNVNAGSDDYRLQGAK